MTKIRFVFALLGLVSLLACAESAELDAGVDGAMPIEDSGAVDATVAEDTGVADTGPDGPPDADADGVADVIDCDPADGSVGRTATMDCTNDCGAGTATCTDGVWTECDAPVDCLCDTEGETRLSDCGMCGQQSERCNGTTWESASECLNQGECAPGAVENERTPMCAEQQRLCQTDCSWGDWVETSPPGECIAYVEGCSRLAGTDWACSPDCERVPSPCCGPISEPPADCCLEPADPGFVPASCFE